MKSMAILVAATTIAASAFGGLFDNVSKAVAGALSPEEREKQRKAKAEERERQFWEENAKIRAEQEEREKQRKAKAEERERQFGEENAKIRAEQEEREKQRKAKAEERERQFWEENAKIRAEQEEREKQRKEKEDREREIAESNRRQEKERLAEERKRQEEAERKEAEAEKKKQEKYVFYGRYRECIKSCRDGSNRESVYVDPELIKDVEQFRNAPIIAERIPLYKNICSGSTLLWTIGQVVDFKQNAGERINMSAMGIPGFEDFKYKGVTVFMPQNKQSDMLCFYCTTEEIDSKINEKLDNSNDVEVFGFAKSLPADSAAEIMERLKKKYQGLKVKEEKSSAAVICGDLVGLKRVSTITQYSFGNDSVQGILTDFKHEFATYNLETKDSTLFLYFSTLEILKKSNPILAEMLEKSFNAQLSETRVGIKAGKFKKEMSQFTMPMQSVGDMERGWKTPSVEVFAMNTAAIYALDKHEQMCKDAIKKGRALMLETQQELLSGGKAAEIMARLPKGEGILKVLDKKALTILPQLANERAKKLEREKEAKENAARAKALEF